MAQITEFTDLLDKPDMYNLSDFNIVLDKMMALDIFSYARSKNIGEPELVQFKTHTPFRMIKTHVISHLLTDLGGKTLFSHFICINLKLKNIYIFHVDNIVFYFISTWTMLEQNCIEIRKCPKLKI